MVFLFVFYLSLCSVNWAQLTQPVAQQEDVFPFQEILSCFPSTMKEVEQFCARALEDADTGKIALLATALTELDFNKAVMEWSRVVESLFFRKIKLTFHCSNLSDAGALERTQQEIDILNKRLTEIAQDEQILEQLFSYARYASRNVSLQPAQIYLLDQLIISAAEGLPKEHSLKAQALEIHAELVLKEMQSFTYVKGQLPDQSLPADETLSILNWNICFFNEDLSMLFGGVLPWTYRVNRIAEVLKNTHADILCLQELFSRDGAEQLCSQLQDQYAHFYIHLGPIVFGFNEETFGIPSGLFIASKYPLKHPAFRSYTAEESPQYRAYGFFTADICNKSTPIARLISTHLQPDHTMEDRLYRHKQIQAILKHVSGELPTFLCGDLNIEKDSAECAREIAPYFDHYEEDWGWTCCELRGFWWKAHQDSAVFYASGLPLEKIDYFLRLKRSNWSTVKSIHTTVLPLIDFQHPEMALSDHQPMMTFIVLGEKPYAFLNQLD